MAFDLPCAKCPVGRFSLYGHSWEECPANIETKRTSVVSFKVHQIVHRAGLAPHSCFTLKSGWASRSVNFPDGRRQILSFLLPGDTVFVEAIWVKNYHVPFTVRALTDVTLCAFEPASLYNTISASRADQDCFALYIQQQFAFAERRLVDVGRRRAVGRIARLVLDLESMLRRRELATNDAFDLPLRQEDIADALGLTTAHVNRTLSRLRALRILEISGGQAQIVNREELQRIAANE